MPFPESDREIYPRNPLREVVCQLRFPPVLEISASAPAAYQRAVKDEYPLYEEVASNLTGIDGAPTEVVELLKSVQLPGQEQLHRFMTEDSQRHVTLGRGFVAITELNYRRREDFFQEVHRAEVALRAAYEPSFYTRTGLRYKNAISRAQLDLGETPWRDLINPVFASHLSAEPLLGEVENIFATVEVSLQGVPDGKVRIRHGLAKLSDTDEMVYAIDSDFFTHTKATGEDVYAHLEAFGEHAGRLFRWAITPRLRDALRVD